MSLGGRGVKGEIEGLVEKRNGNRGNAGKWGREGGGRGGGG